MNNETSFFYLNRANQWVDFDLSDPALVLADDGSLGLAQTDDVFATQAVFMGGPFVVGQDSVRWHRLRAFGDLGAVGGHVQLYTQATDDLIPPAFEPNSVEPFPSWQAAPRDELDILILEPPAHALWVGGILHSDGMSSPSIHQIRVDFGPSAYLDNLPSIYGQQEYRDFMERFLALTESVLGSLDTSIDGLPQLFDVGASPAGGFPSWLNWLAGWLDFELSETWLEDEARQALAQAFELYGQRGTLDGLRRYLKLYAGVEAHITEPSLHTALWSLGTTSTLGFSTMLAPAQLQGAVLGSSAIMDQSHISQADAFGAALFDDVAHHFCVQVYCAELNRPGVLDNVVTVLEKEKPAHTTYHLCVIEPKLRVGVQAQVGIDAIVGHGPPEMQVGDALDCNVLANAPIEPSMRVGVQANVGIDTVVASAGTVSAEERKIGLGEDGI